MNRTSRDSEYLLHICHAIDRMQRYLAGKSESDFMADELIQDGVLRNLEVIGEAVTKLSAELKSIHSDIPRHEISGMRNRLIHGYMEVNMEIVWNTVQKVVPGFLIRVREIRDSLH